MYGTVLVTLSSLGGMRSKLVAAVALVLRRGMGNNNVTKNRYFYNCKKKQNRMIGATPFGGYDYGARFYDPEIGRVFVFVCISFATNFLR